MYIVSTYYFISYLDLDVNASHFEEKFMVANMEIIITTTESQDALGSSCAKILLISRHTILNGIIYYNQDKSPNNITTFIPINLADFQ